MSLKFETLHRFLAEVYDGLMVHHAEPGEVKIIFRGPLKEAAVITAMLRQAIPVDMLMGKAHEVTFSPFHMDLEGLRVEVDTVKNDPYLRHDYAQGHRPVTLHSSQIWPLVQIARTGESDREAYLAVLRTFFPVAYERLFYHPTEIEVKMPLEEKK